MSQTREYIAIGIGGTGVKINSAYWDYMYQKYILDGTEGVDTNLKERFFCEVNSSPISANQTLNQSHYLPRAVYVDEDFEDISRISQNDRSRFGIFNKNNSIYCKKTNGNGIFNHCYLVASREIMPDVESIIRKEVEKCDSFGGFYTMFNMKGGAGGGMRASMNYVLQSIGMDKKELIEFQVWPETTQKDNTVVGVLDAFFQRKY